MKRRTARAAQKRADKPSGKSRYARKSALQRRGKFLRTSPFWYIGEAAPPPPWAKDPTTYHVPA